MVIGAAMVISVIAAVLIGRGSGSTHIVAIYQNNVRVHSIDLSAVEERYTIEVTGKVTNIITVEPGRICVSDATCPDHVCVRQGWISNGLMPIVCLPNSLVIQFEDHTESDGIDIITQ